MSGPAIGDRLVKTGWAIFTSTQNMKERLGLALLRFLRIGFCLTLVVFCCWRIWVTLVVNSELKALRQAGFPTNWDELAAYYKKVPDDQNAALVIGQAFTLFQTYPDARSNEIDKLDFQPKPCHWTQAQTTLLGGYLDLNSNALAKADAAVKLPHSRYPVNFLVGPDRLFLHLAPIKHLAWLYQCRARLAMDSQMFGMSDDAIIAILGVAKTLEAEPVSISQLVRISVFQMAIETMEERFNAGALNDLELANFKTAINKQTEFPAIAHALIGERAVTIPNFRLSFSQIKEFMGRTQPSPNLFSAMFKALEFSGFFERDLRCYLTAMNTNIMLAGLPPPRNLELTNTVQEMASYARKHWYFLTALGLPALQKLAIREDTQFAYLRLATTAIAIEQYRLARGRLPENLTNLTPEFISAIPNDPFDGQPLRYHRLGMGYVVYSIGNDGHDDGGHEKPVPTDYNDKHTYDLTFTVKR